MTTFDKMARQSRAPHIGLEAVPWRPLLAIGLAILVAAGAFFGPRLVKRAVLASLAEESLCPALGIECHVAGPIHLRLLPYPVIEARALTLTLPKHKITVSSVHALAELRALPLLVGRISVNHLELSQASIEVAAPPGGMRLFASAGGAGTALLDAVIAAGRLGDRLTRIGLDHSRILLRSESGRRDLAMEEVSGMAAWPQDGGELFARFVGVAAGEPSELRVQGPDLTDLTRREGSPLSVRLTFGGNRLFYRGRLVKAPDLVAAGTIEAILPSTKRLVKPLGGVHWPAWLPDAPLHLLGQAFVTARGVDFENADFMVGRSRFGGGMSLRMTADGRPSLSGTIATALVEFGDLSFLRPEQIAMPSFGRLPDLDLRMSARRVELGGGSIDAVAAGLILADRRLDLTVSQSSAEESGAKLHLVVTPDEEGISVKLQVSSERLDIGSVLSSLSVGTALTGIGGFSLSLEGHGEDLGRVVRSLVGKAGLQMQKGALSIAPGERDAASAGVGSAALPQMTGAVTRKFSEANFSGIAERGVLALTEGRIGEGASRILVDGKLDLAGRSVDLSLGSAGEGLAEPPWRLRVNGPWSSPKLWSVPPAGIGSP